jgi:CheY-like chemotaxis protein
MSPKFSFDVIPMSEVPHNDDATNLRKKHLPVVLVVDDERIIADTLSIILSKSGFTAMTAYDGISALELAANCPPDLLLTDVMMPGMTGIDLAIAVTQAFPKCKILLFSGQATTVDLLEKARHAGHYFAALTKPVHPTEMLKRISECLATRQTNFQPFPVAAGIPEHATSLPN